MGHRMLVVNDLAPPPTPTPEGREGAGHGPSVGSDAPPGGKPPREKDASVETLRGIAIVLLVAFHAIGEFSNGGKAAGDTGFYSHFNYSLNFLRMPLFTVISGFIYSIRPATSGATLEFLQAKARRILIPFLSVTMLTWAVRNLFRNQTHYPVDGLIQMIVYAVEQLWFLQAVFLAFVAAAILDRYEMMSRFGRWLLCLIVAGSFSLALPQWRAFSFNGFLYLLPYFLLGCGIYRFPGPLRSASLIGLAALLFLVGVTSQQLVWAGRLDLNDNRISPLALSVGLSGNLLLFRFRRPLPILPVLGHYSYSIYLFHFFALSMANRLARFAGHPNLDLLIASRLLFGLLLPIAAEFVLRRSELLRRLFLGLR